ncbi:hypothetical protein DFJ77DRAFT_478169 [Powellomyces hirtus]|nr:hypothetical protein DFJ77DRAFT_478169 [Powellomyces hirtus]
MASDIRDIMQLAAADPAAPAATSFIRKAAKADRPKEKKDGLARELFMLTGGAPPMVLVKRKYKARPNFSKQTKVAPWVWRAFENPARSDHLQLHHWIKASDDGDYYFAKFNIPLQMVQYTDVEYETTVKNLKYPNIPSWTRAETDYLYSLLKQYDLRWFVVFDRYEWAGHSRKLDDLKERYYTISHALLTARGSTGTELTGYTFNKAHELERKKNLETLYARTLEQIREEEHLYHELRRREQKEERMAKEREAVWHLLRENEHKGSIARELAGLPSGLSSGSAHGSHAVDRNLEKLKKRKSMGTGRRSLSEDGTPGPSAATSGANAETPGAISAGLPTTARKKSRVKEDLVRATPDPDEMSPVPRKYPVGVFARSQKIPPLKPAYIARVHEMMHELGVHYTAKPNMPTAAVCEKFAELQANCQTLLEIKKQSDRLEFELDKLRVRARSVDPDDASAPPSGLKRDNSDLAAADGTPAPTRKRASATPASATQKEAKRQRSAAS